SLAFASAASRAAAAWARSASSRGPSSVFKSSSRSRLAASSCSFCTASWRRALTPRTCAASSRSCRRSAGVHTTMCSISCSTMFVFPEPLGPTMAVTPPSNWISVCRAKVLKPSNCRDLRNKLAGSLLDRFPELPAPRRGRHRFFGHRVEGHHLGGDRLDRRGFRRRRLGRRRLALLARRAARAGFGRLRRGRLGQRTEQALEGGSRRVLLRFLLAGSMARAERLRTGEHDRRVLAVLADTRTFAVVHGRLTEALLRDLLEPALEVLVADGRWEGAVAVEVVVVGGVVAGVEKHRAEHCLERVGEQ